MHAGGHLKDALVQGAPHAENPIVVQKDARRERPLSTHAIAPCRRCTAAGGWQSRQFEQRHKHRVWQACGMLKRHVPSLRQKLASQHNRRRQPDADADTANHPPHTHTPWITCAHTCNEVVPKMRCSADYRYCDYHTACPGKTTQHSLVKHGKMNEPKAKLLRKSRVPPR